MSVDETLVLFVAVPRRDPMVETLMADGGRQSRPSLLPSKEKLVSSKLIILCLAASVNSTSPFSF
jgi:hypothetical protein